MNAPGSIRKLKQNLRLLWRISQLLETFLNSISSLSICGESVSLSHFLFMNVQIKWRLTNPPPRMVKTIANLPSKICSNDGNIHPLWEAGIFH